MHAAPVLEMRDISRQYGEHQQIAATQRGGASHTLPRS